MTREDEDAASYAEDITVDMFERYDTNKSNSLTMEEFQYAFLKEPQTFVRFPVLYNAMFNIQIH
jgi:hypothetical protein